MSQARKSSLSPPFPSPSSPPSSSAPSEDPSFGEGRGHVSRSFPDHHHDHGHCIATALAHAEDICAQHGVRFTDIRREVLEHVWQSHKPVGAYDILEALRARGRTPKPPTVYRALEFLLKQGLVHRIERLNAYIGCSHPGDEHTGQFLICSDCGTAAELCDTRITDAIGRGARDLGFSIAHPTVELEGLCCRCQGQGQAHKGQAHKGRAKGKSEGQGDG